MGLGLVFTAKDLASGAISQIERRFLSFEGSVTGGSDRIHAAFKDVGGGIAFLSAGAITLGGAFALASAAGKFEEAIAAVGAVSNASAADLKGLHDAALQAGIDTQYTPIEATEGLRALAQSGFTAQESMKLLKPSLDLAAGSLGGLTPQGAAGLAAQAMKGFGISVDGATFAMDQMVRTASLFKLQAGDLPLGLGHAADGANALHQSLDETLIALGLVRNIIPGIERAATAASVAMERLADPKTQQQLHGLQIEVIANGGHFRKFMDIMGDLAPKMAGVTEQARAAFLLKAFGHHALSGIQAILGQITNGVNTQTGATLKGADAIAYLRDQLAGAGGAAAKFQATMLSTFEGQKKLLRGSIQTLVITLGEPFAEAFKPIVGAITDGLNVLLAVLKDTPAPIKRVFAQATLAAGAFATLVGGVLAAKAAFGILSIGMAILGVTWGGILVTLGSAVAIIGVLGTVAVGLKLAWEANLGGIADTVQRVGTAISLFFQGVSQFVKQGGFSGALREELSKAENAGLKEFLVQCWMAYYRLQRFWGGLKDGFKAAIAVAWPFFQQLSEAFDGFAHVVGDVFSALTGGASALPSERFRAFGQVVGGALATIATGGAWLLAQILVIGRGLVEAFRGSFDFILGVVDRLKAAWDGLAEGFQGELEVVSPMFQDLSDAFSQFGDEVASLFADLAGSGSALPVERFHQFGETVGEVIADIAGAAAWLLAQVLVIGRGLIEGFRASFGFVIDAADRLKTAWSELVGAWNELTGSADESSGDLEVLSAILHGLAYAAGVVFNIIVAGTIGMIQAIVDSVRFVIEEINSIKVAFNLVNDIVQGFGDAIVRFFSTVIPNAIAGAAHAIGGLASKFGHGALSFLGLGASAADDTSIGPEPNPITALSQANDAVASASMPSAVGAAVDADNASSVQSAVAAATAAAGAANRSSSQPLTVNVQVDGETIARATAKANDDLASRNFSPVPVY